MKSKCLEYYQPLQHLSVDEHMVKSKSRCHMIQYMKDKPIKWGLKVWVVADTSGYTINYNIYTGKGEECSEHSLAHDVVMKLVEPFAFQGYEVFVDDFYSSPILFQNLLDLEIHATGTLRLNRWGVPDSVKELKSSLEAKMFGRGNGFYYRKTNSPLVFVCWKDVRVATVMSTAYPGHFEHTVSRNLVNPESGKKEPTAIPGPLLLKIQCQDEWS